MVSGPWYSDATQAYRVEYHQPHRRWSSQDRNSSFYCSLESDAKRLMLSASKVRTWEQWLALRAVAVSLAVGRSDGFLYRVMGGEPPEIFICQEG